VSLEEELRKIEGEIRKLKIEFDLYFVGANPKPPTDHRDSLDKQIKRYQGTPMKSLGDRFLYNCIVNKFNAYSELWAKSLRAREEGVRVHPLALRHAHQAAKPENGGSAGPQAAARARSQGKQPAEADRSWRIPADAPADGALKTFYQSFIAAKDQSGDPKKPSFEAFAREIKKHAASIKGKVDCSAIDFKIDCKDKKVSIKAKPAR
jgi:hypothetical protein